MEAAQPSVPKKRIPVRTALKKAKERAKERKELTSPSKPRKAGTRKAVSKKKPLANKKSKGKKTK